MGRDVLDMPFQEVGCLTTKALIKSTWEFINKHGIKLQHDIETLSFREDDAPIIRVLFQNHMLQEHLISINKCRIYMKLYFLSELVLYNNRLKQFLTTRTPGSMINQFEWPQQGEPSNEDWEIWHSHLPILLDKAKKLGTWNIKTDCEWWYDPR